jgi:pimeloyl-ACP methyl ester carboxylesterase
VTTGRWVRRGVLGALVFSAASYGAVLGWFRLNEDRLLFGNQRGTPAPAPAILNLDSRDVSLPSLDGTSLRARLIPPPATVPPDAAAWILYLHGATASVGASGYNKAWAKFRRMGFGVLAVDYRGFGDSAGEPSEAGLYLDSGGAYTHLTETLHVPPARVIIYGYSLGSAVAIDLASRVPAAGLIVEGALTSVPDRGAELYPYLPIAWLARNRFASIDKIARVTMPKLFLHARLDAIIPLEHGRRLFERAQPPKTFQEVAGTHTTAYAVDPAFMAAVVRFVDGLGLPVTSGRSD